MRGSFRCPHHRPTHQTAIAWGRAPRGRRGGRAATCAGLVAKEAMRRGNGTPARTRPGCSQPHAACMQPLQPTAPLSHPLGKVSAPGCSLALSLCVPHGEPIMVRPAGPCAVRAGTHGGGAARQSVLQTTRGRGTSRDEQGWGACTGVGVSVARGKPPPVRRSRSSSQNAPPAHACRSISIAASSRSRHCGAVNPAVWTRPCCACRAAARTVCSWTW